MRKIKINGLKIRANHGVLPEETLSGTDFVINTEVEVNYLKACLTDDLEATVNYAAICDWIKDEMKTPSKLIEHVMFRIISRMFKEEKKIELIHIELKKINAPIHADLENVAVEMVISRAEFNEIIA